MIKLNNEFVSVKLYGAKFKLNVIGALYNDGNFAIFTETDEKEQFSFVSINLPEMRNANLLSPTELAISHDIDILSDDMSELLEFLTDKEPREIKYGYATSVAVELKPDLIDKLLDLPY